MISRVRAIEKLSVWEKLVLHSFVHSASNQTVSSSFNYLCLSTWALFQIRWWLAHNEKCTYNSGSWFSTPKRKSLVICSVLDSRQYSYKLTYDPQLCHLAIYIDLHVVKLNKKSLTKSRLHQQAEKRRKVERDSENIETGYESRDCLISFNSDEDLEFKTRKSILIWDHDLIHICWF